MPVIFCYHFVFFVLHCIYKNHDNVTTYIYEGYQTTLYTCGFQIQLCLLFSFFLIKIFYALFKFNVHLTGGGGLTFRAFSSISLSFCLSLTLAYLLLLSMVGRTFSSARLLLKLIKSFQCWYRYRKTIS